MNRRVRAITLIVSAMIFCTAAGGRDASANNTPGDSGGYNVLTHVVVGTNSAAGQRALTKRISTALRTVGADFNYRYYLRELTHFQSVGNGGSIGFHSISRRLGSIDAIENPIFTDLGLDGFRVDKEDDDAVSFKAFRFQARLPVRFSQAVRKSNEAERARYEAIKISLNNVRLGIGKPKLIASLPLPEHGETLFFVLEVRKD